MAQAQRLQGTWEEISAQAKGLHERKNLILIIPEEESEMPEQNGTRPLPILQDDATKEAARIAAIQARLGKFSYTGRASE